MTGLLSVAALQQDGNVGLSAYEQNIGRECCTIYSTRYIKEAHQSIKEDG